MSHEEFRQAYGPLLKLTSLQIKALKKDDALEKLKQALEALEYAQVTINRQSDTILSTTNELVQLSAFSRKLMENKSEEKEPESTYAAALKKPNHPIILKAIGDGPDFKDRDIKKKISGALSQVNVNSTKITRNGDFIVNLPDVECIEKTTEILKGVFNDTVNIEPARKLLPKLTVIGLPSDYDSNNFKSDVCKKDDELAELIENGQFEVIKTWDMKDGRTGKVMSKKLAVKVTPDIRNFIMENNEGYIYSDLSRCKVYDRLMVTQCYHCYGFYHIAENCPDKSRNPTCGRCADKHKTENCRSPAEKCINCQNHRPNEPRNHCAFSHLCPAYEREKQILHKKTDYSGRKN